MGAESAAAACCAFKEVRQAMAAKPSKPSPIHHAANDGLASSLRQPPSLALVFP